MNDKNALIIFVRRPELGKVKTRLAATLGDDKALAIYKELLSHTFAIVQKVHADKHVFYHEQVVEHDQWNAEGFTKHRQTDADLGSKMLDAFEKVFQSGYTRAVIIGSDCLQLTTEAINTAFEQLEKKDIVIGPANDGGYYLLGMKQAYHFLFENKQWSTESVYPDTINSIQQHHLQVASLPELIDVDTEEDWLASKQ